MTENHATGGLGVVFMLGLIFVVLKLTGNIDWRWIWVLSPWWSSCCLLLLIFAAGVFFWTVVIGVSAKLEEGDG